MNEHQLRVLRRLATSLKLEAWDEAGLRGAQADLEANLPILDEPRIRSRFEAVISHLDECIHLMDESEGVDSGRKLIECLVNEIEAIISM